MVRPSHGPAGKGYQPCSSIQRRGNTMSNDDRDVLPIPNFDHLPLGSLTSHVRSLDAAGVETLVRHEQEHAARAPVLTMLPNRLAAREVGAESAGGAPAAATDPEIASGATPASSVTPATQGP